MRRIKTGFLLSWFDNNHVILLLVNAPVCVRAQVFEKGVWPHVWVPLCAVLCRADVYFVLKGKLFLLSLYKHERSQGSDDLCSFICMFMIFLKIGLKVIFKSMIVKKYIYIYTYNTHIYTIFFQECTVVNWWVIFRNCMTFLQIGVIVSYSMSVKKVACLTINYHFCTFHSICFKKRLRAWDPIGPILGLQ